MSVAVGSVVMGRWRIVARLGGGAMGDVWRIEALDSPLSAALKTIRADGLDDESLRRFVREAKVMASIRHENVVGLHEVGALDDGTPCLVMDLVDGETLSSRLSRLHALPWQVAAAITCEILLGLSAAHALAVVHRDVKPANILLERLLPHRTRVADFGIARSSDTAASRITATGIVAGTVDYMSPEQLQDHPLEGRSDVYSVGLVLWEMLTGTLPFAELSPVSRALRRCVEDPPPSVAMRGLPAVPTTIQHAVAAMLTRSPTLRPTAREALTLLQNTKAEGGTLLLHAPMPPQDLAPHLVTEYLVAPAGTPLSDQSSATDHAEALVVARLPGSRLAMTSERQWLSSLAQPSLAFSLGAFWFVVVPVDRVSSIEAGLQSRYGAAASVVIETLDRGFVLSGSAALGAGPLPAPLARAIETLSTSRVVR